MIAIIDYDAGNIGSVANALSRLGVDQFVITSDARQIESADGVIFPGQGRAGPAMKSLKQSGLDKLIPTLKQPFLGICLGMQLLMDSTEEDDTQALGIIGGTCVRFETSLPVPHMGWNSVNVMKQNRLLDQSDGEYVYFANSYYVKPDEQNIAATTNYDGEFTSVVSKDNFYGIQFHPEKSGPAGEKILGAFIDICKETA